tara:strand:- start:528 stop:956 length:429 start_codon:yes stop_codon:yes gene_type:complete
MKLFLKKLSDTEQLTKLLFFLRDIFPARTQELVDLTADISYGMTIELKPHKTNRSRPQENYYRKWSREFGNHVGLTPNEMHEEILCLHFGSEEIETPFGIKRRPLQRSNTSNKEEYTELIETLIRVSAEMDFNIPEPRHDDA